MRGRCTLIDKQHAGRMETESRDFFASYRCRVVTLVGLAPRLLRCVFFPQKLLKSFLDGRSHRLVAGSHNQAHYCRHTRGFKPARILIGLLKMGGWVQPNDRILISFHPRGIFLLQFAFQIG